MKNFTITRWVVTMLVLSLPAALHSAQPTKATILLDGTFDDWQTVFANPFNTIFDGDGSSIPCNASSDRDCIVSSATSDLARFAYTWDDQNLYLYVERFAAANNKSFAVYLDLGDDGFMDSTDLMLMHLFKSSNNLIQPDLYYYLPSAGTADSIVDALGFGDGYSLPGGPGAAISNPSVPGDCSTCDSGDGTAFEFAWPWQALGMTPGQAFEFHVAATSSSGLSADDNMAGRLGGRGSSAHFLHDVRCDLVTSGAPQTSVSIPFEIEILGNKTDTILLHAFSSLGLEVCLYTDPELDGIGNDLVACDMKGDGDFTDGPDSIEPGWDGDGDTVPDTGKVDPGTVLGFVAEVALKNQTNRQVESLTLTAVSAGDPSVTASAVANISIGYVAVFPNRVQRAVPNSTLRLSHEVSNHLPTATTYDLSVDSSQSWVYDLWSDPNGDGDPADGTMLFDSDANGLPDVTIAAGGRFPLVAVVSVPISASVGTIETARLTASSNGSLSGFAEDEITVSEDITISPPHLVSEGTAKGGSESYPVFFRHTLTWAGNYPESFDLFAISSQGFPIDFYTDPNGDGNPSDGQLLSEPASTPVLDAHGGSFTFLVRVSVRVGTPPGTIDSTTIFGLAQSDPFTNGSVTDETRVTLVQAFKDPARAVPISHTPGCSTVYASMTGLVASVSGQYRLRWDDPSGAALRTFEFATDANGEGLDEFQILEGMPLGLWSVAVQQNQGGAWVDMDRWFFEVENPGTIDLLSTDRTDYIVVDDALSIGAFFRNNGVADLGPLTVRFRILTPTQDQYLDDTGAYQPYSGVEDTWSIVTGPVPSGETVSLQRSISNISWEETGFQVLEVEWDNECGSTLASTSRTFLLHPDYDGDGANDLDELRGGLDPLDRDTDDDGILDSPDGLGDTDGDGVPDGLSCDADGDGLFDGLEAGITAATADPDTDVLSACFVEDGDAGATTTDPFLADSDGGGIPDGTEDANANGVVDPGEGNPNDPGDDTCPTIQPEEVSGLTLRTEGLDVRLYWAQHPDFCTLFTVLTSVDPAEESSYLSISEGGNGTSWSHPNVVGEGTVLRTWLVYAVSPLAGDGVLGHFSR